MKLLYTLSEGYQRALRKEGAPSNEAGSKGAVHGDRRLKSAHVLYALNINVLKPSTSLLFQAHMDLSLFFISHVPIVLSSAVVFQVQSSY